MNVLETLIGKGWTPTRGVVLAFGFDEEASGTHVGIVNQSQKYFTHSLCRAMPRLVPTS